MKMFTYESHSVDVRVSFDVCHDRSVFCERTDEEEVEGSFVDANEFEHVRVLQVVPDDCLSSGALP